MLNYYCRGNPVQLKNPPEVGPKQKAGTPSFPRVKIQKSGGAFLTSTRDAVAREIPIVTQHPDARK